MLIAALRDLQWRRRRFIIAIIGTGVVFAMTLDPDRACERVPIEAPTRSTTRASTAG